ncbi:MAG: cyclopropane fatty-acyl-phospholipid synthase-like methyltransferase [Myxococcota bacterium]|jgi:cyclopropane fatty-acyl-phospholipid synthase-like methyltransferase
MRGAEALDAAEPEVEALIALAGLQPGARILDMGSGPGRYALSLARRGFDVTCVDRTSSYLTHVAAAARRMAVDVEVVRRDMRDFRRPEAYDMALCVDSFGVFDDEEDDLLTLRNLHASVVRGGKLVLSTACQASTQDAARKDWRWLRPGVLLLEEHHIEEDGARLHTKLSVVETGRIRKFDQRHRLYAGSEVRRMMGKVGFSSVSLLGDLLQQPLHPGPKRLVAVAVR